MRFFWKRCVFFQYLRKKLFKTSRSGDMISNIDNFFPQILKKKRTFFKKKRTFFKFTIEYPSKKGAFFSEKGAFFFLRCWKNAPPGKKTHFSKKVRFFCYFEKNHLFLPAVWRVFIICVKIKILRQQLTWHSTQCVVSG